MEVDDTCGNCFHWRVTPDLVDGGRCYAKPKIEARQRDNPGCIYGEFAVGEAATETLIERNQDG